ncbi:MAG: HAMP domain-containing histidine kinase [Actinobacteria bacterium]|nr:HAMP domain-containing histidine kinase [Actinomycetota bacterium]
MTLRLRLVLALVVLVAAGLAVFGGVTYSLYAHSQYQRLDTQLQTSAPSFTGVLDNNRGGDGFGGDGRNGRDGGGPGPGGGGGGERPPLGPLGTYAELRSSDGTVLSHFQPIETTALPKLPTKLTAAERPRFLTTGSTSGSTAWRVFVGRAQGPENNAVVVAVPLTDVRSSLQRLVFIEVAGALALLALLSGGAWFVLRRGLRPLEQMADTAGAIAGGDLSQRVETAGESSEVGQLGLALNTMLDEIESSFAEREATEQRLRQFLADASHELRTPLTSIQGFAELFRIGGDPEHADLPTIMRRIEQEAARMGVLVEDLLLLARLDQTRPVDREPVDLAVLAADACSDAVAAAPDRPVTLDAPDPVVVLGDQAHLRQAVGNLVTNAVRHTPDATAIEVGARLLEGKAVITVREHGAGLDDEALAHAFDRFWQADKARVGAGAGLGLAIVAGAVAEHGGTATAANAEGGGALFTLTLPLQ